jgi:hypothetical protein
LGLLMYSLVLQVHLVLPKISLKKNQLYKPLSYAEILLQNDKKKC